jgi:glycosyltransferase involved in cell wall biosynthesis
VGRALLKRITPYVREFDRQAAQRVDYFIANSSFVQTRIRDYYGRDSEVIHPPVAIDDFSPGDGQAEDFYLIVSQLVGYKRIDVAVERVQPAETPLDYHRGRAGTPRLEREREPEYHLSGKPAFSRAERPLSSMPGFCFSGH